MQNCCEFVAKNHVPLPLVAPAWVRSDHHFDAMQTDSCAWKLGVISKCRIIVIEYTLHLIQSSQYDKAMGTTDKERKVERLYYILYFIRIIKPIMCPNNYCAGSLSLSVF